MIALLVMTDGRDDVLDRCLAQPELDHPLITERWIHDDTGDAVHRGKLRRQYPTFMNLGAERRRGFGGAIRWAWESLAARSAARFVLHMEDDFLFNRPPDLANMACVLDAHPYLAQMALKRQPWGPAEEAAGGFLAMHPDAYTDMSDGGHDWLEQRLFFTTNPSLYRRDLCAQGWPTGRYSEGVFTHRLLADPSLRFGYWGRRDDPPAVEHIGMQRVGSGY